YRLVEPARSVRDVSERAPGGGEVRRDLERTLESRLRPYAVVLLKVLQRLPEFFLGGFRNGELCRRDGEGAARCGPALPAHGPGKGGGGVGKGRPDVDRVSHRRDTRHERDQVVESRTQALELEAALVVRLRARGERGRHVGNRHERRAGARLTAVRRDQCS